MHINMEIEVVMEITPSHFLNQRSFALATQLHACV